MEHTESHYYRRTTCRICHSQDIELVLSLKPTPVGDAYERTQKATPKDQLFPLD